MAFEGPPEKTGEEVFAELDARAGKIKPNDKEALRQLGLDYMKARQQFPEELDQAA